MNKPETVNRLNELLRPILDKDIGEDFYESVARGGDREKIGGEVGIVNGCLYWQDFNEHIHFVSLGSLKAV